MEEVETLAGWWRRGGGILIGCFCCPVFVEGGKGTRDEHWHEEEEDNMEDERGLQQMVETQWVGKKGRAA
jgi:hypothetical protein